MESNGVPAKGKSKATKFTDRFLQSLRPPESKKDYSEFDSEVRGLGVRVTRSSKIFGYKRGGVPWRPLGRYPATSIADARKAARALTVKFDNGVDIVAEHRATRARKGAIARGELRTLEDAVEGYIEENPHEARQAHLDKTRRTMRAAFGKILDRPLDGLTFEEIRACARTAKGKPGARVKTPKGGPGARSFATERISVVLHWAAAEYGIADPLVGKKKKLPRPPPSRESFLSGPQMRKVFSLAGSLVAPAGPLLQFMMLVPVRRSEAACMRWDELDGQFTAWTVPAGKMKGGRRARMYWAPLALQVGELLRNLLRHEGSDFVFTHTGKGPANSFTRYKKLLDQKLADAGLPEFRLHDFRRSFNVWATGRQEDFAFDAAAMADRCLGHEPLGRVQKIYNPFQFCERAPNSAGGVGQLPRRRGGAGIRRTSHPSFAAATRFDGVESRARA
jgi:integrase